MEQQTLLTADYLDIVFDHRNKAYGGYELRRNYPKRIKTSLLVLLMGTGALCSFALLSSDKNDVVKPMISGVVALTDIKPEIKLPIEPVHPPSPRAASPNKASVPKIVKDDEKIVAPKPDINDIPKPVISTNTNNDGNEPILSSGDKKWGKEPSIVVPSKPAAPPAAFTWAEQMPEFDGKLNNYLSSHLNYPPMARENNIEGSVVVRFLVNEDGSIDNVSIVRGIDGGCNEEAMRVVKNMPRWKPGKQNGKAVKVFFTLPIMFKLM